tara:strand:+ start:517 stop:708 length:192 start_codon:yes stop_codon:yes gene_type:complete
MNNIEIKKTIITNKNQSRSTIHKLNIQKYVKKLKCVLKHDSATKIETICYAIQEIEKCAYILK